MAGLFGAARARVVVPVQPTLSSSPSPQSLSSYHRAGWPVAANAHPESRSRGYTVTSPALRARLISLRRRTRVRPPEILCEGNYRCPPLNPTWAAAPIKAPTLTGTTLIAAARRYPPRMARMAGSAPVVATEPCPLRSRSPSRAHPGPANPCRPRATPCRPPRAARGRHGPICSSRSPPRSRPRACAWA
jgi:hypothetical protein